eukprot:5828593-Pleurochrysis_carterae.AAC.3
MAVAVQFEAGLLGVDTAGVVLLRPFDVEIEDHGGCDASDVEMPEHVASIRQPPTLPPRSQPAAVQRQRMVQRTAARVSQPPPLSTIVQQSAPANITQQLPQQPPFPAATQPPAASVVAPPDPTIQPPLLGQNANSAMRTNNTGFQMPQAQQ